MGHRFEDTETSTDRNVEIAVRVPRQYEEGDTLHFHATNASDRKRCDWCRDRVHPALAETHALLTHGVPERSIRIEPGMTV